MTNYKKLFYILVVSLLCLTFCSCSIGLSKKACNTVEQLAQAASSNNDDLFMELAPYSKDFTPAELSVVKTFWKYISDSKHKISFANKNDSSYFVKVSVLTQYNSISVTYIFECKYENNKFYVCPEYKVESLKKTIDYIELKDLTESKKE